MNTKAQNRIKVMALALLLAISGPTLVPHKAHAFLGGLGGVGGLLGGVSTKEYVLDPIAYGVNKAALQSLTKSVLNWANSGFNGSPAFVQDLNKTLLTAGDTEASSFIDEFINSGSLENVPWKDDIAQSVLSGYLRSSSRDSFSLENPYTLDQVSDDPQAFVQGDFSKGGLDAWMSLVLNPANSPRGLYEASKNRLNSRVSSARGDKLGEVNRNNGFLSFRGKCPSNSSSSVLSGALPKVGVQVLSFTILDAPGASGASDSASTEDAGGGTTFKGIQNSDFGTAKTTINLGNKDTCAGQPILTPGSLISHALNTYTSDIGAQTYISNDEISELVGSLFGGLIGNVLGSGGVAGVSAPKSGGGKSYIDQATSPAAVTKTQSSLNLTNDFISTLSDQQVVIQDYKIKVDAISATAIAAKTALGTTTCPTVDQTISQMQTLSTNATISINQLDAIRELLISDTVQDQSGAKELVASATTQYQQLQSSPTFPTAQDIAIASSGVLLGRMQRIASTGVCQ